MSLFVEAFKELLERHAAFKIYCAVARAADKESERKRRDEAREKKDEEVVGNFCAFCDSTNCLNVTCSD